MTFIPNIDNSLLGPSRELITGERELIYHFVPHQADGESVFRILETETGSGTFTVNNNSEWDLATTALAADAVEIKTHDNPRFYPMQWGQIGFTLRAPDAFTGDSFAEWGHLNYSQDDGVGWGVDSSGLYVWYKSNTTKTKTASSSFSNDALGGLGPSGLSWDNTRHTRFTVEFPTGNWQNVVEFCAYIPDDDGRLQRIVAHRQTPVAGAIDMPSSGTRAYARIDNGTNATARAIYISELWGARAGGRLNAYRRGISQFRFSLTPGTTPIPTVTFRKKAGREDTTVYMQGFEYAGGDKDLLFYIRQNSTLSPTAWGNPNSTGVNESAVEQDITATGTNSGTARYIGLFPAGGGRFSFDEAIYPRIYMYQDVTFTLYVRTVTGTSSAMHVLLRVIEEW
jgi:hypothetical protein